MSLKSFGNAADYLLMLQGRFVAQPQIQGVRKRGLLSRIFGRNQGREVDALSRDLGPVHEEPALAGNIVILNSLNHSQLLELLKVLLAAQQQNNVSMLRIHPAFWQSPLFRSIFHTMD